MAAGDYRLRLLNATIFPLVRVVLEYEFGVEDGSSNTNVLMRQTLTLTWDEFVALTTSTERQNLASINGKMKDEIKVRHALLADALDL